MTLDAELRAAAARTAEKLGRMAWRIKMATLNLRTAGSYATVDLQYTRESLEAITPGRVPVKLEVVE